MKQKYLTEVERVTIRAMHNAGFTYARISEAAGRSIDACRRAVATTEALPQGMSPKAGVGPIRTQTVAVLKDGGRLSASHGVSAEHARETVMAMGRRRGVVEVFDAPLVGYS